MAARDRIRAALKRIAENEAAREANKAAVLGEDKAYLRKSYWLGQEPELKERIQLTRAADKGDADAAFARYLKANPKVAEEIIADEIMRELAKQKAMAQGSDEMDQGAEAMADNILSPGRRVATAELPGDAYRQLRGRARGDYNGNMALVRGYFRDAPLAARQALARRLTEQLTTMPGRSRRGRRGVARSPLSDDSDNYHSVGESDDDTAATRVQLFRSAATAPRRRDEDDGDAV